jgi:hypothetical protein
LIILCAIYEFAIMPTIKVTIATTIPIGMEIENSIVRHAVCNGWP